MDFDNDTNEVSGAPIPPLKVVSRLSDDSANAAIIPVSSTISPLVKFKFIDPPLSPHPLQKLDPDHEYLTIVCTHCGKTIHIAKPCGDRFCSVCNGRRTRIARMKITGVVNNHAKVRGCVYRHVTLSTVNCPNLKEGVDDLIAAFRRLRQRAYWSQKVMGGVFTIEVTGSPGNWHPHLHILVYTRGLSWNRLSRDWNACSGGLSCYIQAFSPYTAILYMTKYITKASVPAVLVKEVSAALKGKRLYQFFGSWHGEALKIKTPLYFCSVCGKSSFELVSTLYSNCAKYGRNIKSASDW